MNDSIFTKMIKSLQESKKLRLNEDIDLDKDETEEPAEGTVNDVVAVVDPDISSDDYEKVIQNAEETIDQTPNGEQPTDEQYVGQNIYTCPICGNAFFTEVELDKGDACPVCSEVPEAFIFNGKVEGDLTDEDEELVDNLEDNLDDNEEASEESEMGDGETPVEEQPIENNENEIEDEESEKHESLKRNIKSEGKLNEVRRIEKKRIVVGYDVTELDQKIIDELINRYKRSNNIKDGFSYERIIEDSVIAEFREKMLNLKFIDKESTPGIRLHTFGSERTEKNLIKENEYSDICFCFDKDIIESLNDELKLTTDSEKPFYTSGYIFGDGYRDVATILKKALYNYTNFPEISKTAKKEILKKLNEIIEECKQIYINAIKEYIEKMDKESDSITDLKKLQNEPILKELSKYWYAENGREICLKSKAKVVETESYLTEAPVNLEFDDSFDVYKYDELDDYGKKRAFDNKRHLANNLYGKRWPALQEQITEFVTNELEKIIPGIKVKTYDEAIEVTIMGKPALKYAKENGIDFEDETFEPSLRARIGMTSSQEKVIIRGSYYFKFNGKDFSDYSYYSDEKDMDSEDLKELEEKRKKFDELMKDLKEEFKMDVEGIYNKVQRMIKKAHEDAENDYKAKMSKQNKEYLSNGTEYKEN